MERVWSTDVDTLSTTEATMATGRRAPLRCALMTGSCFSQRYVGDDWSEIGLITAFLGRSPRAAHRSRTWSVAFAARLLPANVHACVRRHASPPPRASGAGARLIFRLCIRGGSFELWA